MRASNLAKRIAALTFTRKAADVVVMDLRALSPVADYFVVCSADSDTQVRAIADAVEEGLAAEGIHPWHREAGSPNWFVLDFVDVVLHVFHRSTRTFYNLEKLWGDAKITHMKDAPAKSTKPRKTASRRTTKSKTSRRIAS